MLSAPPRRGGERSERASASVVLAKEGGCFCTTNVISMQLPKNNHPCRLRRLPLLRPPVLAMAGEQEGSYSFNDLQFPYRTKLISPNFFMFASTPKIEF